jgi:lysophospholipase L1-like esterase
VRRVVVRLAVLLIALAVLEVGVRVLSAFVGGPRVLLYGTPWFRHHVPPRGQETGVEFHSVEAHGYTKYFPHEEKWANDSRGRHRVRINDHGLRGPDFADAKKPGVLRVLTLGASSTFGFENRDDETYPYYLQHVLDRAVGPGRFEVINFAVPHADSDAIASMFAVEGVPLAPDVVTVYEGVNDSERAVFDALYGTSWRAGGESHFLLVTLLQKLADAVLPKPSRVTVTDAMISAATKRYLGNLDAIAADCRKTGARMIVVTQQARSLMVEPARLRGLRYEDEVKIVEQALAASEPDTRFNAMQLHLGAMFDVHSHLMHAVRDWAAIHRVPLVDGIAKLDRQRDLVLTWVHLAPPANKMLARAIAGEILRVTGLRPTSS